MQQAVAQPEAVGRTGAPGVSGSRVAALAVIIAGLVAGLLIGMAGRHTGAGPVPVSPAIEARWGVRVTRVAVTADGGLVDVRFIVLDPDKALAMMESQANLPALRPVGKQVVIDSVAQMAPRHDLVAGQTYFLLYHNQGNALQSGTRLSVTFHDLVLPDVVAE